MPIKPGSWGEGGETQLAKLTVFSLLGSMSVSMLSAPIRDEPRRERLLRVVPVPPVLGKLLLPTIIPLEGPHCPLRVLDCICSNSA